MSLPVWAARFGITNQQVADLKSQLAGHDEPLRWLLANGHIPAADYMRWARDEYGLPSLKDDFFAIPADPIFWEAVKSTFQWTTSFVPLAEWQGVLLIGCLEPPSFHFPFHCAHRFVLAPVAALEERFNSFDRTSAMAMVPPPVALPKTVAVPKTVASPTPFVTAVPLAPAPVPVSVQVRQRPADEVLADQLPPAPDVSLENPDGLVFDVAPASSPNLFVVPDGLSLDDIGQPLPTTPDGFEGDENSGLFEMDGSALKLSPPIALPILPPMVLSSEAPAPVAANKPVLPPGPPPRVVPMPTVSLSGVMPPPVPIHSSAKANVASTEPALPLATCSTQDALLSSTVAHISSLFEHGLVLMFENGVLRPRKWSEHLLSVKGDNADPIPLEEASIFRIAFRTSLPYHGYVSPNPINTLFFNAFTRGLVPKHITIMPVSNGGRLVAMLMGLSNVEVDYKASLTSMEKLASDFGSQLDRLKAKKAA